MERVEELEPGPTIVRDRSTPVGRLARPVTVERQVVGGLIELGLIALAAPILWLPWRWPALTLVALTVLPLSWALAWRRQGRLSSGSGLEAPLVYVLVATCVAAIPVAYWDLALPKLLGMALGATTLVTIANLVSSRASVSWAMMVLAFLTLGISGIGLLGAGWKGGHAPVLAALSGRLPGLLRGSVPGTPDGTIQPNELAGVLVLVASPLVAYGSAVIQLWSRRGGRAHLLQASLAFLAGSVAVGIVILTQSRSGVAGAAVSLAMLGGVLVVGLIRSSRIRSRTRAGLGILYLSVVMIGAYFIGVGIVRWFASGAGSDDLDTFASRMELWDRSISMLQDFAFTGIGIGQFDPVLHALYTPLLLGPLEVAHHAHNLFLEYALELGIPGALAVMLLVIAFSRQCLRAVRARDPLLHWVGIGLLAGVLGYLIYGLVDAIAPGARAGIVVWIVLGLGAAVGNVARQSAPGL